MSISNMTKLSATISFLDIHVWNPALAFVMGGSIAVGMPVFYYYSKDKSNPLLFDWDLPFSNDVDWKLITGQVLFGCGWGLVGACPGPALVNFLGNTTSVYPKIYLARYYLHLISKL